MKRQRGSYRVELRLWFLGFLLLCLIGVIVGQLWWVQVARGAMYAAKIGGRSQVTVRIPSVRGEIRDRNGIPLVQNRASYEVDFYLPDMVRGYRQRARERGQPMPIVAYRAPVKGMLTNMTEADIVKIVNTAVIPRLQQLELAQDYNAKHLQRHYRNDTEVPFTYLEDINFATIAKYSEHDVGLPGVDISIRPVRQYLYGALGAHLLGYVGAPVDIDREEAAKYNFYQADVEGKSQIEQAMDKWLKGTPGVRIMQRNVKGVIESEASKVDPKPGNNVYLTIDARIQFIAEQALREVGRGAAVVVDPSNGEILAMASVPSYDPNVFIPSISSKDWDVLRKDDADPLVNRAVSAYPPGSTFKIVTALSGLRRGLANSRFNCSGSVSYGDHAFHCWIAEKGGSHGTLPLPDAIKVSCNCFFYQFGNAAGIDAIDKTGATLGLGLPSEIGLTNEQVGVLPGPDWMKIHSPNEKWSQAYTANVSIGQGYDLVTPLQNCMVYATVANGGVSYYPRLIKKVLTPEGQPVLDENGKVVVPDEPKIRGDLRHDFTTAQIDLVRKGLWKVVNEDGGTGKAARMRDIVVAGKTGTATAKRNGAPDTIAWFVCFAPFEQPRYAVAVMVNGGEHGGSVAAPIADRILEQTIAMDHGAYTPQVAALTPARKDNPFKMIPAVVFKDSAVPGASEDQETLHSDAEEKTTADRHDRGPKPDIRPDADARGRVRRGPQPAEEVEAQAPENRDRRNVFQRFFQPKKSQPKPQPEQQPGRRPRWPF